MQDTVEQEHSKIDTASAQDTVAVSQPGRRRWMKTAGAAVATAGALPAVAAIPAEAAPSDQDSSYSETEHVRDYYRTTRV